jgi:hypothetical protein
MDPWARPIIDIFQEYYSLQEINSMFASGKIEIAPLAYMRGRTFKKSIIIADEMQNSSPNQMLMLATRIGEESKLCITGDLDQTDRHGVNGLMDFINKVKYWESKNGSHEGILDDFAVAQLAEASPERSVEKLETKSRKNIEIIEFEKKDIERSPIVSKIMDIYSLRPSNFSEPKIEKMVTSSPFLSPSLSGKSYSEVTANSFSSTLRSNEKLTFLAEASPESKMNFSKQSAEKFVPKNSSLTPEMPLPKMLINKVDGNKDASLIPRDHYTKNVIHLLYKNDEKVI